MLALIFFVLTCSMEKVSVTCLEGLEVMLICQTEGKRYCIMCVVEKMERVKKKNWVKKRVKNDPARIRTWNPLIRSQMPYPLGHRALRLGNSFSSYLYVFNSCKAFLKRIL